MEKTALVYINENYHKLVLMEVEGSYFNIFEDISETVKLGEDIIESGLIKSNKLKESLNILKIYRKLCDFNGVTKITAVCSSFILKSKNQKSFFEETYNNTGFNFIVMTPEDEIKAKYLGVINTLDVPKGVIIDISTSETALISYNRRNVVAYHKMPFGSANLIAELSEKLSPIEKISKAVEIVKKELKKVEFIDEIEPETAFVGTGDIFVSLGKLARKSTHYSLSLDNNYVVSSDISNKVFDVVKDLELDKTKKLKGISEDSVEKLTAGLCIYKAICESLNLQKITISTLSEREGLIHSYYSFDANDKPFSDMLGYSLETIRTFNNVKYSNSAQIYNLSVLLFKQLKVIHKLPRIYVKALRIAASMYDCGKRVNFDNHEKYSFNVILGSKLCGASHKDVLLGAFACMCQNLDNLNLSDWIRYKDILDEEDMEAVKKIGMLVKLADMLDKSKKSLVNDISCDILGDSVILKTIVESNVDFEIMEGMKLSPSFKKIFKKFLEII